MIWLHLKRYKYRYNIDYWHAPIMKTSCTEIAFKKHTHHETISLS